MLSVCCPAMTAGCKFTQCAINTINPEHTHTKEIQQIKKAHKQAKKKERMEHGYRVAA